MGTGGRENAEARIKPIETPPGDSGSALVDRMRMPSVLRPFGEGKWRAKRSTGNAYVVSAGRWQARAVVPILLASVIVLAGAWGFTQQEPRNATLAAEAPRACHRSYVGRCLPIGRDVDCDEVGGTVRVVGSDVYLLDVDRDGWGCEPTPP